VLANVVPCRVLPKNTSKANAEVTTWMRRKKLDEGGFLLRQAQIARTLRWIPDLLPVDKIDSRPVD